MLLLSACTPQAGGACTDGTRCDSRFVCATIPGSSLRRCLLPCASDPQHECEVGMLVPGLLCADGSVCTDSDQGPVCLLAGRIGIGRSCPDPGCDSSMGVCACEPGTRCQDGVCRQVCDALPRCPDTLPNQDVGPRELCAPGETCAGGVCIP